MKRTNLLLMMCLMALVAFNFSSCSKDDDDKDSKKSSSLIGVWANDLNPYKNEHSGPIDPVLVGGGSSVKEVEYYEEYLIFDKDGGYVNIDVTYDKNMKIVQKDLFIEISQYQITKNGNTVKFKYTELEDGDTYSCVATIDGFSMTLNVEDNGEYDTYKFHRIDKSEVEKFLAYIGGTGDSNDFIGAYCESYAKGKGDKLIEHFYEYKDDGTFRDYLIMFKGPKNADGFETSWYNGFSNEYEFLSTEYVDYEWKLDGPVYYQRKKGAKQWDVFLYQVDVYGAIACGSYYYQNYLYDKKKYIYKTNEDEFVDFIKNAKKAK